jgi:hypothetical protein
MVRSRSNQSEINNERNERERRPKIEKTHNYAERRFSKDPALDKKKMSDEICTRRKRVRMEKEGGDGRASYRVLYIKVYSSPPTGTFQLER